MYAFFMVIFLFVCIAMTIVILLQSSKGGGLAGAFGGGGDMGAVFGGRGAATFLTRLTTGLAIAFLSVSLILSFFSKGQSGSQGLIEQEQQKMESVPAANLPVVPTSGAQPGFLPVQTQEASSDSTQ